MFDRRRRGIARSSEELPDTDKRRPRVLLYSHDGLGLGHLRLTLALAEGLTRRRPDAAMLLLTGSPQTHAYVLPTNCDSVKLPSIEKRRLFPGDRVDGDLHAPEDIFAVREAIIKAVLGSFAPHLVVVDHEPGGLAGELRPALTHLRERIPAPRLVVGLRDITYGPEETRTRWRSDGIYELLDHIYDRILVYGSQDVFDPIQAYGLSPVASAKTTFTGYIRRPEPVQPAEEIRRRLGAGAAPIVVVTVGGGTDGAALIRTYLEVLRGDRLPGVVSFVVGGPHFPKVEFAELRVAARKLNALTLISFSNDIVSYVAAADVVVTMGGYNSVFEALASGKRPIVVPRAGGSDEQRLRAERLAALGLVTSLPESALTVESLALAIQAELNRDSSPAAMLDFGGLERATEVFAEALDG